MYRAIVLSFQIWLCLSPADAQAPFASFDSASAPVLNDPHDLELGPDGHLYIADKFGNRIVVMDRHSLEVVDVIDEGQLPGVHDIDFGPDGRAYAAITGGGAIAVYKWADGKLDLETFIGPFPRTEGVLAHSNGQVYVMASGSGELVALRGTEVTALAAGLWSAHDVVEAPDGSIWVADTGRSRLVRYSQSLDVLQILDDPEFGFVGPRYLDVDDFGRLVVADQDRHRILLIDPVAGRLMGVLGSGEPGIGPNLFDDPEGVLAVGNTYYFSDSDNNRIVKYVVILN